MNQTSIEKQQPVKCKTPIIVLTMISLIGTAAAATVLSFDILFSFLAFICKVLFLLYVIKFHQNPKTSIIIPIILGWNAVDIFSSLIFSGAFSYFNIYIFLDVFTAIGFILATISALKGLSNKLFWVISFVCVFIRNILTLMNYFNFFYWTSLTDIMVIVSIISSVAFDAALLLFGLKNRIPSILASSSKTQNAAELSPEQNLRLLKEKFDLGIITEEEYRVQRAEVIDKM